MFARSFTIVGEETLGISRVDNMRTTYYHQRVPLPTMLNYQLDTIAIIRMTQQQQKVVEGLDSLMFKSKKIDRFKVWYEVFLTTFVLLSTLEYVYQMQQKYLQRHKGTVCKPWIPETSLRTNSLSPNLES